MIIVFGSLNVDMVMPVDHFPKPGETVLCAMDYLSRAGGKGSNQAIAAVRTDAKVGMIGKIGDDAFGRRSLNNLQRQSVLTSGIGKSDRPTGCATIMVDRYGENMVVVAPGANLELTSDQVPDEILIDRNIVLAQLEVALDQVVDILRRADERGVTTILNAAPVADLDLGVLKTIRYLIVNEVEASQLAVQFDIKETAPIEIARALSALGLNMACIITLEDKGSVAVRGEEAYTQGSLEIEIVDSTGAGDAFCGVFAACLQAGKTWVQALHYANVGASLSCLGLGAQAGMPFMEDIEASMDKVLPPQSV